jgi:uncharacterized protein (DUF305 family)
MSAKDDAKFARDMFDHHMDAVKMSARYLKKGTDKGLLKFAENTIEHQGAEMDALALWLERNGL